MFYWITLYIAAILFALAAGIPLKSTDEYNGVVLLDAVTYPKLLPSSNYVMMVLIVQKKQIGEYGTDSIRADYFDFADFVQRVAEVDNEGPSVLFSQIIVNGAQNAKLAKQFGLDDDFTHPALFAIPRGKKEPVRFPAAEPYHKDSLLRFLTTYTDFYFQIPGTLKQFDKLVVKFMNEPDQRESIRAQAEEEYTKFKEGTPAPLEPELLSAKFYVDVMASIIKQDDDYIQKQIDRIENMIKTSKLTISQRVKQKYRLNVLKMFRTAKADIAASEL